MLGMPLILALGMGHDASVESMVVIIADDLARSDLEVIPTPNIDALASSGLTFRRAYAMPVCAATRETTFFGQWTYIRHRRASCDTATGPQATNPMAHSSALVTIADIASSSGLETGLFGKWHLGKSESGGWESAPGDHGFEHWFATVASPEACGGTGYKNWLFTDAGAPAGLATEYNTDAILDEASEWIQGRSGPFFAWVSFNAPHIPLHVPPASSLPPGYTVEESDRGHYEAAVVAIDRAIGEILSLLDLETTVVVFLGDNGTPPQALRPDQDPQKVKRTTFEDGINVPMIAAGPNIAQGVSDALVHVVDLYATVNALAGNSNSSDGLSLLPVFANPSRSVHPYVYCGHRRAGTYDRAIVTDRWKYRENPPLGEWQLYDLDADPTESSPFLPGSPEYDAIAPILKGLMDAIEGA